MANSNIEDRLRPLDADSLQGLLTDLRLASELADEGYQLLLSRIRADQLFVVALRAPFEIWQLQLADSGLGWRSLDSESLVSCMPCDSFMLRRRRSHFCNLFVRDAGLALPREVAIAYVVRFGPT